MKVNWATTSSGHQGKIDSTFSEHFHIFVGDLAPEVDAQQLRDAFATFGDISDVKIMKDPHTHVHKGYGFISFVKKVDAETAIASMNGQWIGTRKIRTNWATRKVQPGSDMQGGMQGGAGGSKYIQKLDYNEVWNRSSENNTTVYCGGISAINEDIIRNTFAPYGQIIAVHPFPDRGYAFVRFANKEAACNAICGVHGMDINGCTAKCSWGKENIEMASPLSNANYVNQQAPSLSTLQQTTNAAAAATNVWAAAAQQNPNWAAANYQWTGYTPNTMNYWQQQYPGYQNAMMQQGWGLMPTAATSSSQFQMGQNPQGYNAKS